MFNLGVVHHAGDRSSRALKGLAGDGEARRHVERLLLRLDFNGEFSRGRRRQTSDILKEGGLG